MTNGEWLAVRPATRPVQDHSQLNSAWKIFGVAPRSWPNNTTTANTAAPSVASRKYQPTSLWWLHVMSAVDVVNFSTYLSLVGNRFLRRCIVQCWRPMCLYFSSPGIISLYSDLIVTTQLCICVEWEIPQVFGEYKDVLTKPSAVWCWHLLFKVCLVPREKWNVNFTLYNTHKVFFFDLKPVPVTTELF